MTAYIRSIEYRKLLKTVYIKIGTDSHLLSNPTQTWHKHLAQILLLTEEVGFELVNVSLVLMRP